MSPHLADRIVAALREAPEGLSCPDLRQVVYADRPPPAGPDKVIRQTILRMRRRGMAIGFDGRLYILPADFAPTASSMPNGGPRRATSRAAEIVALLREYEEVGLTARDLADEMAPTHNGHAVLPEQVSAILRREVPRLAAVERIGSSYRLASNQGKW